MTDKKSNDSRRKLLKSIAAGSGAVVAGKTLPESWSKPVINSIVLPAHATTTDGSENLPGDATTTPQCCLTTGLYCGGSELSTKNDNPYVEIDVAADGTLKITAWRDHYNQYKGSDSILCTGGYFTAELAYISTTTAPAEGKGEGDVILVTSTVIVTGTVICGQTSIKGLISWDSDDYKYDAILNKCAD